MIPIVRNKQVRLALKAASEAVPLLPNKGDGWVRTVLKLLAIYNSLQKVYGPQNSAISDVIQAMGGLEGHSNTHFVQLFFSTAVREEFQIQRIPTSDYTEIVVASNPRYGTLFFVEWRWGPVPEWSDHFWASRGFAFKPFLDHVWRMFDDAIHVDFRKLKYEIKTSYSTIEWESFDLQPSAQKRFDAFVGKHRLYQRDGISRVYLFKGLQGAGKTTFALRAAKVLGKRTLRLNAIGLTLIQSTELDFLLDHFQPDVFIVDDLDKVDLKESLPKLLTVLAEFKIRRPQVVAILTANGTDFDPAFIRPGRIDEKVEFKPPDFEERLEILRGALMANLDLNHALAFPEQTVRCLAKASEGLTAAYLQEVALQLKYETPYQVYGLIHRMRREVGEKNDKKSENP